MTRNTAMGDGLGSRKSVGYDRGVEAKNTQKTDARRAKADQAAAEALRPGPLIRWHGLLASAVVIAAAALAYNNSYRCVWALDDFDSILHNQKVRAFSKFDQRSLWDRFEDALQSVPNTSVSGRPLVSLTLALNYRLAEAKAQAYDNDRPHSPDTGRGFAGLTGYNIETYHVVNLLIHIVAALLLLGVVRRTLVTYRLKPFFGPVAATVVAAAITVLWTVHPLQTESVTYVIQRLEAVVAIFMLASLYCVIRGRHAASMARRYVWYVLAVIMSLLGMASKEVAAIMPLLIVVYDMIFLRPKFAESTNRLVAIGPSLLMLISSGLVVFGCYKLLLAIHKGEAGGVLAFGAILMVALPLLGGSIWHLLKLKGEQPQERNLTVGVHVALALTVFLFGFLWSTGPRDETAGFSDNMMKLIGPIPYGLTQPEVITQYLKLTFYPADQCLDYAWPLAARNNALGELSYAELDRIIPYGILILVLLVASVVALWKAPVMGFLGAWFFIILAPTSSFIPLADLIFEHRMYMPLAAIIALVVGGAFVLGRMLLGGGAALTPGRDDSAAGAAPPVVELKAAPAPVLPVGIGVSLVIVAAAILTMVTWERNEVYAKDANIYQDTVNKRPTNARAHSNLGYCLANESNKIDADARALELAGKPQEAAQKHAEAAAMFERAMNQFANAIRLDPNFHDAYHNRAVLRAQKGQFDMAEADFRAAIRIYPRHFRAHNGLAGILANKGDNAGAEAEYKESIRWFPDFLDAHVNYSMLLERLGRHAEAMLHLSEAVRINAKHAEAYHMMASILLNQGKEQEACAVMAQCIALRPDFVPVRLNLAWVLAVSANPAVRNPQAAAMALGDVMKIPGADRDIEALRVAAAVAAANGKFPDAVAAASQCVNIAQQANAPQQFLAAVRGQLNEYQQGRPLVIQSQPQQPAN
jgi:tetratricopeptide (TPR) repeat protein